MAFDHHGAQAEPSRVLDHFQVVGQPGKQVRMGMTVHVDCARDIDQETLHPVTTFSFSCPARVAVPRRDASVCISSSVGGSSSATVSGMMRANPVAEATCSTVTPGCTFSSRIS